MLLIESVKAIEVRGDEAYVRIGRPAITSFDPAAMNSEISVESELVRGQRFYDMNGRVICIGMTQEVQDALKLPFDVYADLSNSVNSIDRELSIQKAISYRLRYRLDTIKGMPFWERLSRVFVGFSTLSTK